MHKLLKKIAVLGLFTIALCPINAYATSGELLHQSELTIAPQIELADGIFWHNSLDDRLTEHYIEYTPNPLTRPIIAYGNYIYGGNSLANVEEIVTNRGYNVIAAINGDYFNTSPLIPLSAVIEDGILKGSEGSAWSSVGFYDDGQAIISRLDLDINLVANDTLYNIGHFNKDLGGGWDFQLYSRDFADTTRSSNDGYHAILEIISGYPGINQTVNVRISEIIEADGPVDIPDNGLVVSIAKASGNTNYQQTLAAWPVGQEMQIVFNGNPAWQDVQFAVGGGEKLLTNGQVVATDTSRHPRTAVGIKADGTVIFYTVDGRQANYSQGATLIEVAQRLQELGCVEALNLDGGGSTGLIANYPGDSDYSIINQPSGGYLRNTANYILLVSDAQPQGAAAQLHMYPYDSLILGGASLNFEFKASDNNYLAATVPQGQVQYSLSDPALGSFDNQGNFIAGSQGLSGYVYATIDGISGQAKVTVIETPDLLGITDSESGQVMLSPLRLFPGETANLSITAMYNHLPIISDVGAANWSLNSALATIDQSGLLSINSDAASEQILLTAGSGDMSVSLDVEIRSLAEIVSSFEHVEAQQAAGYSYLANNNKAFVRYGEQSAAISYDFAAWQQAQEELALADEADEDDEAASEDDSEAAAPLMINIPFSHKFADIPPTLSFWLYGDGSGNLLSFSGLQNGQSVDIPALSLDFDGWQHINLSLPNDISALQAINITLNDKQSGRIYLDQMLITYSDDYRDLTAPTIMANLVDNQFTATISDNLDYDLNELSLELYYDNAPLDFIYQVANRSLTATLPESDGNLHRLTLIATDKSGNISRHSIEIAATALQAQPFVDMGGHWASTYTTYLYNQGIINGIMRNDANFYDPDSPMTRAQFAVIISNYLGLDLAAYSGFELPFADNNQIGDWAKEAVAAIYSLGISNGSMIDGELYYYPNNSISRAEAMTMIGRILPKGYAEPDLNFDDNNDIPTWAYSYISTLVDLEVVSGNSNNRLMPADSITRSQVAKVLFGLI